MPEERQLELCCACDEPTGHAGRGSGSLYVDNDDGSYDGPFCEWCFDARQPPEEAE